MLYDIISHDNFTEIFFSYYSGENFYFLITQVMLFWYVILVILSWIVFTIQLIKNNDEFKKLKQEIPLLPFSQFFLIIIFSLLIAIPLKIIVNNKLSVRFRYLSVFTISLILYEEFLLNGFLVPISFFIFINKLIAFLFEKEFIFKDNSFYGKYIKFFFYGGPKRLGYTIPFNIIIFFASIDLNNKLMEEIDLIESEFVTPAVENLKDHLVAQGVLSGPEIETQTSQLINKMICEEGLLAIPFNRQMPFENRMLLFFKKCISFLPSDFTGQYLYIYFIISCIMIGISIYLFMGIIEKNKPLFDLLEIKFNRLNFVNKLLLVIFSFIYGIPNLVYINQPSSRIRLNSILFVLIPIIFRSYVPIFDFVLFFWFMLMFHSYLVYFLYERNNKSKYIIDLLLFGGDSDFAKFYFDFFWGK